MFTDDEHREIAAAAAWYFNYASRGVDPTDRSAYGVEQRERLRTLHSGLRAMGLRVALPDTLRGGPDEAGDLTR